MKRVLTAVVLIPVVLVLVFLPPQWHWLFTAGTAAVAALAAWEFLGLAQNTGAQPPRVPVLLAILALFAAYTEWPDQLPTILGILSLGLLIYCAFTSPTATTLADTASSVFCLIYTGLTLITVIAIHEQANGPSLVIFLFFVVWAGDIVALLIGRAIGRHKLAPRLSPGKTWEGAVGSMVGSLAVAGGLLALSHQLSSLNSVVLSYSDETWWYWLGVAALVNVAAQVGDLAESALKRSAGVKDSGNLLPGHGGMLDRIDALLLAAPALWYAQVIHHSF